MRLTQVCGSMTGGSAPVTLTPPQNLTPSVQFSPAAAGNVNGSISIVSNATGSPATVSLSGTGDCPALGGADVAECEYFKSGTT
jgi:hypothetical protein